MAPNKPGCLPTFLFVLVLMLSLRAFAWNGPQPQFVAVEIVMSKTASEFAPIDYFDRNCARCHGNYGANYLPTFMALPEEKLKTLIDEMAHGPAQAPIDATQLERETAYHRSLQDGKPFIAVTKIEESSTGMVLSGEATPKSTLTLKSGEQSTLIALERHAWSVSLPQGTDIKTVRLTATKDGEETSLALSDGFFSHQKK